MQPPNTLDVARSIMALPNGLDSLLVMRSPLLRDPVPIGGKGEDLPAIVIRSWL
jgi:hypothetical protein